MTKKKPREKIPPVMRLLISTILLFGVLRCASTLSLNFFGETTTGVLDSYDNRHDNAKDYSDRMRTISITYHFHVGNERYNGYATYHSDEIRTVVVGREEEPVRRSIRYLPQLPYVNSPEHLADLDALGVLFHFAAIPACVALFLLVNGWAFTKTQPTSIPRIHHTSMKGNIMFCTKCGTQLPEDAAFCRSCGAPTGGPPDVAPTDTAPPVAAPPPAAAAPAEPASTAPTPRTTSRRHTAATPRVDTSHLVGWSERCNHPEILAAAQKNKKSAVGCMWALTLLFPIGFLVAGLFVEEMPLNEAIIIGVGLGLLMLVINLIRIRDMKKPIWEGVVTEKFHKDKSERDSDNNVSYYVEYTLVIRATTGKKHRIVNRDRREMYDYFEIGDRVRYHPTFSTYEKYDKSKDKVIYCNVCSRMNPIINDRCERCNNLLFK